MFVEGDFLHDNVGCLEGDVENPLVIEMENGHMLRIDRAVVRFRKTIINQLREEKRFEVKFCISDDEELNGTDIVDQYQITYFPMYRKEEEIAHLTIDKDSIVNGNIVIEDGQVVSVSSNYRDPDYENQQDVIVDFATGHFKSIIVNC